MADNLYTGRRAAGLEPDSDYELSEDAFYYAGSIAAALAPQSAAVADAVFAGSIGLALTSSVTVVRDFTYIGRRGAGVVTDENNPEFSKPYAGSVEHSWQPDFVDLEAEFAYAGSIPVAALPDSDYGTVRSYAGTLTVELTPASSAKVDAAYTGSVTVALTPTTGTATPSKVYEGSITVQVRPVSTYEGSGVTIREYTGNIPVALYPAIEAAVVDAVYAGSLPLALLPAASSAYPYVHSYTGAITVALTPEGVYLRIDSGGIQPIYFTPKARTYMVTPRSKTTKGN